jgi:hypothetical protein
VVNYDEHIIKCSIYGPRLIVKNTVNDGDGFPKPFEIRPIVCNKCIFCCEVYATNARSSVCNKCSIILTWKTGMDCLAAVNRLSDLLRTNKLDSNFKNENYCKERFGIHATQVIMDAIDSSRR